MQAFVASFEQIVSKLYVNSLKSYTLRKLPSLVLARTYRAQKSKFIDWQLLILGSEAILFL